MDRLTFGQLVLNQMEETFHDLETSFFAKLQSDTKGGTQEWSSKAYHMPILDYYSHILDDIANNPQIKPKLFAAHQSNTVLKNHVQKLRNKTKTNAIGTKRFRINVTQKFQNARNFLNRVSKGNYNKTRKRNNTNDPINLGKQSPTKE